MMPPTVQEANSSNLETFDTVKELLESLNAED